MEHGFGNTVQQSQYNALSHRQYAVQKVNDTHDFIRKRCETPFNYPISVRKQYQEPKRFNIAAEEIIKVQQQVIENRSKQTKPKKTPQLRKDLKELERLSHLLRPQPIQSVRERYKSKSGFAPTVTS